MNRSKFESKNNYLSSILILGASGAILTALFLALVSRELELTTPQKYLTRFVDLHKNEKNIQIKAANLIKHGM